MIIVIIGFLAFWLGYAFGYLDKKGSIKCCSITYLGKAKIQCLNNYGHKGDHNNGSIIWGDEDMNKKGES